MTIVFSGGTDKFLVMANDSAVELQFGDGRFEYQAGRKAFCRDGVGVVTMWGARDGNRLISHLESLDLTPDSHTVEDLANAVHRYLTEIYAPHRGDGRDDTGYHVGGFTAGGQVRLYHIFWNAHGSGNARTNWGTYTLELHDPPPGTVGFLYNGRPDIVSSLIQTLIGEINQGKELRFPFTASGICRLAHFVLRVGSELTKQVAPTFLVHLLSPSRRCIPVVVDPAVPSDESVFAGAVAEAGLV
jgi:hypothetical protein